MAGQSFHLRTATMTQPHSEMFELLALLKEQAMLQQEHEGSGATLAAILPEALNLISEHCLKLIEQVEAQAVPEAPLCLPATSCTAPPDKGKKKNNKSGSGNRLTQMRKSWLTSNINLQW